MNKIGREKRRPNCRSSFILAFILPIFLNGCFLPNIQQKKLCEARFSPQKAMQSSDYAGFLLENERQMADCKLRENCDLILFNIGFVYAYSKSPFYDRTKALKYFAKIIKDYPQSPWAYESLVWVDLLTQNVSLDLKQQDLEEKIKSKERAIRSKDLTIKSKDAAIEKLRDQMKQSREIDVEMGQREREILY